jgi:hypothetical protein
MSARLVNGILYDHTVFAMDSAMPAPAPVPAAALDDDDMRISVDVDGEITLILPPRKTK